MSGGTPVATAPVLGQVGATVPAVAADRHGTAAPGVRTDLQFSEQMLRGSRCVHLVRDPHTGRVLEIGPREHFLMTHLDGSRSLADISAQYHENFGRTLDDAAWAQLLGLLHRRDLLAGGGDGTPAPDAATPSPDRGAPQRRLRGSVLSGEMSLVRDADALCARWARRLRPLLGTRAMLALAAAGAAGVLAVVLGWSDLLDAAGLGVRSWVVIAAAVLTLWVSGAAHELAHGVVAHRFGGTVSDLGVAWRLPGLIPFARVSDYHFLPTRTARLAAALAGVVANLLFVLPALAVWLTIRPAGMVGGYLALTALAGTALALVNLDPIAPLDGYVVLGLLAGVLSLTTQSQAYVALAAQTRIGKAPREQVRAYPVWARRLYLGYSLGSAVLVLGSLVLVVIVAGRLLADEAGLWGYAGAAAVAVMAVAGMATSQRKGVAHA